MASPSPWVNRPEPSYAPPDSEAVPFFGPDPCWSPDREGHDPESCPECRGRLVAGATIDPLASGINPKTGNVVAFVCQGCNRSLVRNPRGRLMPPNQETLDAYGDLAKRDSEDRTVAAVKLSKRGGKSKARKAS